MSLAITGTERKKKISMIKEMIDTMKCDYQSPSCFFIFRDIKKIEFRLYVYMILVLTKCT